MMDDSWSWWAPGALFMVICMVAMAWMMMGHGGHGGHGSHSSPTEDSHGPTSGGAEGILAERLARGHIDLDEYERHLTALRQSQLDRTEELGP